jgi:hypothetical protein
MVDAWLHAYVSVASDNHWDGPRVTCAGETDSDVGVWGHAFGEANHERPL